jgi:hypothetical protein
MVRSKLLQNVAGMDDIDAWRDEILAVSNIVQDDDESVSDEEAERRFNRFIELVDAVRGDEPDDAFLTLLETLEDQADYGAYESVFQALLRFSPARRGRLVAQGVLPLLRCTPELAGDVLSQLALDEDAAVVAFNRAIAGRAAPEDLRALSEFIAEQEQGGWLAHDAKRGRLRVE